MSSTNAIISSVSDAQLQANYMAKSSAAAGIGAALSPLAGAMIYANFDLQVALFAYATLIGFCFVINMIFVPAIFNYVDISEMLLCEADTDNTS